MMTPGWGTALFGMGLGRYPETYYWNNLEGIKPASFRYETERGNTYLRLSSGSPVNFEQIVHIFPGQTYTLSLDMRSNSPKAALAVPLCAKSLLYSFHCVSLNVQANSTSNTWSPYQLTFNSGSLGEGTWLSRQPVKLALYNAREGTLIDVDNIRLFDQRGNNLIVNGDFSKGNANWFFSTDNHLPWHIKNVWVALVFDQGWLGLIAFSMLLAYAVYMLFGRIGRGDIFAVTLLASITGFLAVGLFDSPFDASRLSMLFFTLMSLSVAGAPVPGRIEEIRP